MIDHLRTGNNHSFFTLYLAVSSLFTAFSLTYQIKGKKRLNALILQWGQSLAYTCDHIYSAHKALIIATFFQKYIYTRILTGMCGYLRIIIHLNKIYNWLLSYLLLRFDKKSLSIKKQFSAFPYF